MAATHNPEVAGSNPAPATKSDRLSGRSDWFSRFFYRPNSGRSSLVGFGQQTGERRGGFGLHPW